MGANVRGRPWRHVADAALSYLTTRPTWRRSSSCPPYCIAFPYAGRTPLQTILVDMAGLENCGWHLFEYDEEVRRLYDALLKNFRRLT